ncbi:type II secretion system F family protein [Halobacillus sp. K22]|uniref:type II secretion system F family protein n=1 Tax=Halobacillus sp. K22 TaxID=3457431 RepID=UPI003FCE1418
MLKLFVNLTQRKSKLPVAIQILFFHRLSHILHKGYPLLEALKMTGWDPSLRPLSDELNIHLSKGETIDNAFLHVHFSPLVTNFLYFGRVHQDLPAMFKQCEELLKMKKEYSHKLFQVLRYPLFLLLFLIAAFSILKHTILPNFLLLFQGEDSSSLWFMMALDYFINGIVILSGALLVVLMIMKLILPRLSLNTRIELYEKVPLLKIYHSFMTSFLFTTHLNSLFKAGLPLKQSLEIMSSHHRYELLSFYSEKIILQLAEGKTLGQSVHSCSLLKSELTNLFHQTSDIEALNHELEMLSEFFIEYVQEKMLKWMQMIQPLFFIIIAVIVVCIYASIMLPLYQWMDQI